MPVLLPLFIVCLIAGVAFRIIDPVVPQIAREFGTTPAAAALLATAYTLPYAIALPFIGGFGDAFGKVRMIKICLSGLLVTTVMAALAWSYEMLFIARVLGGIAGGSVIPLALAVVGDRYPIRDRQVALSHLLTAMLASQVFGMSAAGLIADAYDWRTVIWVLVVLACFGLVFTFMTLKPRAGIDRAPLSLAGMARGYRELAENARARWCFAASAFNGLFVFGLMPWVATMLEIREAGSIREAGFVIAGLGIGGFAYTFLVRYLLSLVEDVSWLMLYGGGIAAAGLLAAAVVLPWYLQMIAFAVAGFGFFMFHGSVQTVVSEVSPRNRGAAVALHSTAFIGGQAAGPILYAVTIAHFGVTATIVIAAVGVGLISLAVSGALRSNTP